MTGVIGSDYSDHSMIGVIGSDYSNHTGAIKRCWFVVVVVIVIVIVVVVASGRKRRVITLLAAALMGADAKGVQVMQVIKALTLSALTRHAHRHAHHHYSLQNSAPPQTRRSRPSQAFHILLQG